MKVWKASQINILSLALEQGVVEVLDAKQDYPIFQIFEKKKPRLTLCSLMSDPRRRWTVLEHRTEDGSTLLPLNDVVILAAIPLIQLGEINRVQTGDFHISACVGDC